MKQKNILQNTFILMCALFPCIGHAKTIIYDYNGVLSQVSRMGIAREIGFLDTACYYLFDIKDRKEIEERLFLTLEKIGGEQQAEHKVCGSDKKPLPELMCRWMDGRFDAASEKDGILNEICRLKKEGFFKNNREYRVIKNTINIMFFKPQVMHKHRRPIKGIMKIAKAIKSEGKHQQLLLSNMDALAFESLLTSSAGTKLLQVIPQENMVVSAKVGFNKPHNTIYEYLLKHYNLDSQDCVFLDDQLENVEAARSLGITSFLVTENNHNSIRKQFKKLGILPTKKVKKDIKKRLKSTGGNTVEPTKRCKSNPGVGYSVAH